MSIKNQPIKVGISVGDINGIGVEIILKTLQDKLILDFFTPILYGSTKLLNLQNKLLGFENQSFNGIKSAHQALDKKINVVNLWNDNIEVEFGVPSPESGKLAIESFKAATEDLQKNNIDVLVTAPFNKEVVQSDQYQHPGHTEYLAEVFQHEALMILTGSDLNVALVTQHIPISKVPETITKENVITKAQMFHQSLKQDFYITRPKIAVLALNPHAGDKGLIGKEEIEQIEPAIQQLNQEGILALGPYSPDSFFIPEMYKNFDGVLAMYHDQGLIPFKSIHFNDGVNFTAGLSKIRTSPDHGVAYDIAGKGIADETSFKEAVFKAIQIFKNRLQNKEDLQNPLKISNQDNGIDEDLPPEDK